MGTENHRQDLRLSGGVLSFPPAFALDRSCSPLVSLSVIDSESDVASFGLHLSEAHFVVLGSRTPGVVQRRELPTFSIFISGVSIASPYGSSTGEVSLGPRWFRRRVTRPPSVLAIHQPVWAFCPFLLFYEVSLRWRRSAPSAVNAPPFLSWPIERIQRSRIAHPWWTTAGKLPTGTLL